MGTQIKLLRLIQERHFQRVGGQSDISCDVRFIAATNRDLNELIAKKRFREDLFHRINVVSIKIPPLRERKEDIPALFEHFVHKEENRNSMKKILPILRNDVKQILNAYFWPGNIRELENSINQAIVLSEENILQAKQFKHLESISNAPKGFPSEQSGIVDAVYEGKATWDDIRDEFAAASETRREILLSIIDRWSKKHGRLPTSKELSKLLAVSETNMRQIRKNHRIQVRDIADNEDEGSPDINRFCKEGEFWRVTFEGRSDFLKDRVGMRLLSYLLQNPGRQIHCLELSNFDRDIPSDARKREFDKMNAEQLDAQGIHIGNLGDAGEKLTKETIENYKVRLKEIRQELKEAEEFNDTGRIERLWEEQEWLEDELTAALGLHGKTKKDASVIERARQRVSKNLNSAKNLIKKKNHDLFSHFEATLRIGTYCSYNPPDTTTWTSE